MPSFFRIIALVLLTIWLPATMCCEIEAAQSGETPGCYDSEGNCTLAFCDTVCRGMVTPADDSAKQPVSAPASCACFICLSLLPVDITAEPLQLTADVDRPRDWVPVWHFVRRDAPLSRAPSMVG